MQSIHRLLSRTAIAAALACTAAVQVQAATPAASTTAAPAAKPIDAEKQKLIDKVLTLWHPENVVIMAVQRPAGATMEQARVALQNAGMPADKIESTLKDITPDVQKYVDTATPLASASAKKNLQQSIVPMLAQNFSNDELKQLIALLESPVKAKFEKLIPEFDNALGKRVQDDVGAQINKDIGAMTQTVRGKLQAAASASAPAAASAAAK